MCTKSKCIQKSNGGGRVPFRVVMANGFQFMQDGGSKDPVWACGKGVKERSTVGHMQQFSRVVENSLPLMSLVITSVCDYSEDCPKCAQWLSRKQKFMLTQSIYNEPSLYYVVGQLKLAVSSGLLVFRELQLQSNCNCNGSKSKHMHMHTPTHIRCIRCMTLRICVCVTRNTAINGPGEILKQLTVEELLETLKDFVQKIFNN